MTGPCGWTVTKCDCSSDWASFTAEVRERATILATHFMWAATGRRYGLCELTVMPCNPPPAEPLYQLFPVTGDRGYDPWAGPSAPVSLIGGQWHNNLCGSGCRCSAACEISLDGPVDSILEVTVGGEVVDVGAYQVHDRRLLVRVDGYCWPACATYGSEIPGFEVTYLRGTPIPAPVQSAVEALACEYGKACTTGGGDCRLPTNLASLSRQGVEVTVAEVDSARGRLRTGIARVDDVLEADNPYGLIQAPTVISPDMPPPARVVTWAGGS